MSRSADIDFWFSDPVTIASTLKGLGVAGWGPEEPLGVSYFVEEDGDPDWERGDSSNVDSIQSLLDAPENADALVGISIYSKTEQRGGSLLFFPGRTQVSFMPSIDRKPLVEGSKMTDMGWYLNQLLAPLLTINLSGYEARDILD